MPVHSSGFRQRIRYLHQYFLAATYSHCRGQIRPVDSIGRSGDARKGLHLPGLYVQLYDAAGGSLDGYADVVGAHAPGFKAPPEVSPDEVMQNTELYGDGRYFTFRRVEDLRLVMEKHNGATLCRAVFHEG